MEWFEKLPDQCPPKGTDEPDGLVVYRLLKSNEPSDKDFAGKKKNGIYKHYDECILKSLSVWSTEKGCRNISKLPAFKNEPVIAKIRLVKTDGLITQTGNPEHYSWWRSKAFDISLIEILA